MRRTVPATVLALAALAGSPAPDAVAAGGCPLRKGYERVRAVGALVVTKATSGDPLAGEREVWRVCRRGSGRDVVFTRTGGALGTGTSLYVAGANGHVLAVVRSDLGRGEGCLARDVETYSALDGRRLRRSDAGLGCGVRAAPRAGALRAITTTGVVAWLADGVLRATGPEGRHVYLDRGDITDLRADGPAVRWRSGGAEREAVL